MKIKDPNEYYFKMKRVQRLIMLIFTYTDILLV